MFPKATIPSLFSLSPLTLPHGWIPNSRAETLKSQLTVDADGHGVVHALAERLVLGLADKHAAVVLGLDVHLQQADGHVPAKVPGLEQLSKVVMKKELS